MLLHEFGHIFAARRYRIPTPDILLTPIGGIARIGRLPERPSQELVIALAGPAVTLVIAALLGAVVWMQGGLDALLPESVFDVPLLTALCWTNVILLVFNMIPAFPMDGGRVLRAILAGRIGMVRGTRIAVRVGQGVALLLAIAGFRYNPMLMLIALFIFLGAEAELEQVQTRELAGGLSLQRLLVTDVRVLNPDTTLSQAITLLTSSDQRAFPVLAEDARLLGLLTRDDILRGLASSGMMAPVTSAMVTPEESGTIHIDTSFEVAVQQLMLGRREALPVVDQAGHFAGLITRDNVTDVMLVERLRQQLTAAAAEPR